MEREAINRDLTEAERRIANIVRCATIADADYARSRVRVKAGEILSGWLPFATVRAGKDRSWHPPEVGEQVVVVSPGGDLAQGVVIGAIYRAAHPAPGDRPTLDRTVYKDNARVEYDRESHTYTLDIPPGGRIVLRAGASSLVMDDQGVRVVGARIDLN